MTKPRITAAMLRKRPQATAATETPDEVPERAPPQSGAALPMQSGSIADHPSFRAPQLGIRPKREVQTTVHVQRSTRRGRGED
jgi:hypothetical protein